ncbi:hypothetical protein SteCoe_30516 [Stentor coeruleus]|uniref:C2H2-type domain-containing protein n=1 Tax=Stentor coeruleus TaxID=5963 RepID=A0A1R2B3R7_9CILI|nr:hypothetical protein SteCoe_30516 [Stentor coeruleus]
MIFCCPSSDCGREYKCKFNLKRHFESSHLGLKHFICEMCNKSFASKQILKEHMHRHLGIKPYKCPVCQHFFRQYSQLCLHRRKHDIKYRKAVEVEEEFDEL